MPFNFPYPFKKVLSPPKMTLSSGVTLSVHLSTMIGIGSMTPTDLDKIGWWWWIYDPSVSHNKTVKMDPSPHMMMDPPSFSLATVSQLTCPLPMLRATVQLS